MQMSSSRQYVIAKKREGAPATEPAEVHPDVLDSTNKDIWTLLFGFRLVNALLVRTFFQPDEYFQSLEPAWQMAFGPESGAWITWEWHYQLRSSLHPALFAGVYYLVNKILEITACFPQFRAMILSVLPNVTQAVFAAAGDYYTWKLSEKIYGLDSNITFAALIMTVLSPWHWFCSTRTFSNSLEMTMTIAALYYWPWNMSLPTTSESKENFTDKTVKDEISATTKIHDPVIFQTSISVRHLRIALLLAGTASILRPTNLLIWFTLLMPIITNYFSSKSQASTTDYLILIRESILCGSTILALSAVSDYLYYGTWTFPPYQWLHFNISQDLAVFYGANDWHYYLSQGLPLLLTTYLPFTLIALWQTSSQPTGTIRFTLLTSILLTLATLSLVSHKEVRFIYPLLPLLHTLTAPTISSFFQPPSPRTLSITRRLLSYLILLTNIAIATYSTLYHQSGVISVPTHLRYLYEAEYLSPEGGPPQINNPHPIAGFLMPCHSTPWRSQLYHANLTAWALTCEPPIHLSVGSSERADYLDEADRFYANMSEFLDREVGGEEKPWPRYIVGFEGVEEAIRKAWKAEAKGEFNAAEWDVVERYRAWNSHWHDDSRRTGDVIIWEMVGRDYGIEKPEVVEVEDNGFPMFF